MACSLRWRISSIQSRGRSPSPSRRTSSSRNDIAFSSEVGTGSRKENASKKRKAVQFWMRAKPTDAKLINLFLDMLAAEQGAGDNTLQAYRRDLTDFSGFLARSRQTCAGA